MSRFLLIFILAFMPLVSVAGAKGNTDNIRKEKQAAQKAIKENQKKLKANRRQVDNGLRQLRDLEKEIGARDFEIGRLQEEVGTLDRNITLTTTEIDSLALELEKLRGRYTTALRRMQTAPTAKSPLGFLMSASSMNDFFARIRYVREFSRWRAAREKEIAAASAALGSRRASLDSMKRTQHSVINRLNINKVQLKTKQTQTDRLVDRLKRENRQAEDEIARRRKQIASLDRELDRIIEADRRARERKAKAARRNSSKYSSRNDNKSAAKPSREAIADHDRELTGSFESNRGRLLFPVSGRYRVVRGFGKGQYSNRVQTSHLGIDIEVPAGTSVRAIFDGVVTNVSRLDGFNTIAVIRHGNYLSVYVNLASVSVSAGQKIGKGQVFGTVAPDENRSAGLLQFGIRKERQELNPLEWVR